VVYRFDVGGLENGLVNLVNSMQGTEFRHCVVALTEATDFSQRLRVRDVDVYALGKRPGKDPATYLRLFRLLRRLKPTILHTRNIGTLDCAVIGRIAGVPVCVHGEHGWDVYDPDGTNPKYRRMRRLANPFVRQFVTVSADLREWLIGSVGIPVGKVVRICNGVDTGRFVPRNAGPRQPELAARFPENAVVVGSVLRFEDIKDPQNLVQAFIKARERTAESGVALSLVMIGDGPLRQAAIDSLEEAGLMPVAWLPGCRDDVPELIRSFDLFVLGSRREGISNTVLEAMASGLPVIATDTGGNRELVRPDETGSLVAPENPEALAAAIRRYAQDAGLRQRCGITARQVAESEYSLATMVENYARIYRDAIRG
jgi:sugar transferase (PEP-CTERM/EpsH1 system associated)